MGVGLRRSPGTVSIVQNPWKPLVWGSVACRKEHLPQKLPRGGLRRQGFPTLSTHVFYAAAALAGDDAPGLQCTKMMYYARVCQAYTCRVPNVVKNVRQIENEIIITDISWAFRLSI